MANVVTFDPNSLRIIVIDTGENNISVDVFEIYSEWKEWVKTGDNAKHPMAFSVVGGNPLTDTQNFGSAFFLTNNWRIRPAEKSHRLTLNGNLFTDPFGFSPVVSTLGNYNVVTEYNVSSLSLVSRFDQETLDKISKNSALSVALIASK